MSGLGRVIAGLGAVAGGYVKGDEMRRRREADEEDRAFQKDQRGRQKAAWAREDQDLDLEQGARAAFKTAFDASGPSLAQAVPASTSGTTTNPQASMLPGEPPAPNSLAAVPAPAQPIDPDAHQRRLLAGLEAQAGYYGSKGVAPKFKEAWMQAAELRSQIRAKEFEKADGEFRETGDPLVYARRIYPLIADGREFVDGQMDRDEMGRPVLHVKYRDQATGREGMTAVKVDKFMDRVKWARDPKAVLAAEAAQAKAMFEHGLAVQRDAAKEAEQGRQARLTEGIKHGNALSLENLKTANNKEEIQLRGKEDRTTKSTPSYGDKNFTLSDGAERFTTGKDGKPVKVAGNDKASSSKVNWTKLASDHYGESPVGLSGNRTAGPQTMALAISAQEIYDANAGKPGMTPERAIEMAAKAHGKTK